MIQVSLHCSIIEEFERHGEYWWDDDAGSCDFELETFKLTFDVFTAWYPIFTRGCTFSKSEACITPSGRGNF